MEDEEIKSEYFVLVAFSTYRGGGHGINVGPFTSRETAELAASNFEKSGILGSIKATMYWT